MTDDVRTFGTGQASGDAPPLTFEVMAWDRRERRTVAERFTAVGSVPFGAIQDLEGTADTDLMRRFLERCLLTDDATDDADCSLDRFVAFFNDPDLDVPGHVVLDLFEWLYGTYAESHGFPRPTVQRGPSRATRRATRGSTGEPSPPGSTSAHSLRVAR
jgi:hypothetical protein